MCSANFLAYGYRLAKIVAVQINSDVRDDMLGGVIVLIKEVLETAYVSP